MVTRPRVYQTFALPGIIKVGFVGLRASSDLRFTAQHRVDFALESDVTIGQRLTTTRSVGAQDGSLAYRVDNWQADQTISANLIQHMVMAWDENRLATG